MSAHILQGANEAPPEILWQDRLALFGMTRSGKSTVARGIFESVRGLGLRLVVDPADSEATLVAAAKTAKGPREPHLPEPEVQKRVIAALEAAFREVGPTGTIRFVPGDPERRAEYQALAVWCFGRYPLFLWIDEGVYMAPSQGCAPAVRRLYVWGAKYQIGMQTCHTRPVEVNRNVLAQASHVLAWFLPLQDDRETISQFVGLTRPEIDRVMESLERAGPPAPPTVTGFAWFDLRTRRVIVYDPPEVHGAQPQATPEPAAAAGEPPGAEAGQAAPAAR